MQIVVWSSAHPADDILKLQSPISARPGKGEQEIEEEGVRGGCSGGRRTIAWGFQMRPKRGVAAVTFRLIPTAHEQLNHVVPDGAVCILGA